VRVQERHQLRLAQRVDAEAGGVLRAGPAGAWLAEHSRQSTTHVSAVTLLLQAIKPK